MNLGGTIRINKFALCIIVALTLLSIFYISTSPSSSNKDLVSLKKLLIASVEASVKGGKEVALVYSKSNINERSKGQTKEGVNNPVTDADDRSNCVMYYSLTHTFPKVTVISEEKSPESACLAQQTLDLDVNVLNSETELEDEEVAAEDVTIWIDPLDATKEFTEKLPQYVTTMVCVAVKGNPVIGVIHFPFLGEEPKTTWAWVHKAISSGILKKKLSGKGSNDNLSVIVSRSHTGEVKNVVKEALGESVEVVSAGGAGYKALEVASTNFSAYIHTTSIMKWDICAGNAILNALDGHMTTLGNENIDYGAASSTENSKGILATLFKHDWFIEKLSSTVKSN